jgi:hypothetical protein
MMQHLDPTWNPHFHLEFFKVCVRVTLSPLGQIIPRSTRTNSTKNNSNKTIQIQETNYSKQNNNHPSPNVGYRQKYRNHQITNGDH